MARRNQFSDPQSIEVEVDGEIVKGSYMTDGKSVIVQWKEGVSRPEPCGTRDPEETARSMLYALKRSRKLRK